MTPLTQSKIDYTNYYRNALLYLACLPEPSPLASEILRAMPEYHARRSNLYVDDELYVWEENDATLRYSQIAGVPLHVVSGSNTITIPCGSSSSLARRRQSITFAI